jgi:GDP-L-fucose synthase
MTSPLFELEGRRVWVAGHRGMVGSAVVRRLAHEGIAELLTASSGEVDLTRQDQTERFVADVRPDLAIIAAARVGGIQANRTAQADFLYDNLMIAANCLDACRRAAVSKVVVLGSSCIYPRESPQPIKEEYLLTGPLEETNEGYAVAKIAALELGKMQRRQYGVDVVSLMPTNLYGPGDNYDLAGSHVLPALLRKTHDAKTSGGDTITIWGSGRPRREFLHVDDLADATIHVTKWYSGEDHLNVGTGEDISILELARLIGRIVGWDGEYVFDPTMPDGTPRKLLDISRLRALGWEPSIELDDGIASTYQSFLGEHVGTTG